MATYTDPSLYRIGESRFRQLVDALDAASPQRSILADRRVTLAELNQAFASYGTCLDAAGFMLTSSAWDPLTNTQRILAYAPPAGRTRTTAATGAAPEDACEDQYWTPAAQIYAADTPSRMDPQLASAMVACMDGKGYDARRSTSFGDLVGAVGGRAQGRRVQAGQDCLARVFPRLYPDLPYLPRP